MKIDLHTHTNNSIDSIIDPKKIAAKSKKLGIVFANTDHNTINAHKQLKGFGATFIPGEEISTDRGDLIGLYVNEVIPKRTPFEEAINRIHSQGGLAYLPHMYDHLRKGVIPSMKEMQKLDIVEIFNSRCLDPKYNDQAREFALGNNLLAGVGTDSHYLFEFGSSYAEVPDFDISDPNSLLKALAYKSVKYVGNRAPFYVRGTTTMVAITKKLIKKVSGEKPSGVY